VLLSAKGEQSRRNGMLTSTTSDGDGAKTDHRKKAGMFSF